MQSRSLLVILFFWAGFKPVVGDWWLLFTGCDCTFQPVYDDHTWAWDSKKVAIEQRWPVFGGFSINLGNKICLARLNLNIVDRWPLFRGGSNTDLTSILN